MTEPSPALRRVLGTPLLVFYGLGVIIGAGIYVLVGSVVGWPERRRRGRSCWRACSRG